MSRSLLVLALALVVTPSVPAQELPKEWADSLQWRAIGAATMGGRIISFAVYEKEPSTWWAATASGGLVKTTNNGITFAHQFDREAVVSIGHVAVSQSDKDVVWVGTGEANPRNSVSYGNGVYKSTDGGNTWKHMGLHATFQIGRIAIHPTDPDTVYVGALGRLYGPNAERGLYKTTDGGKTWTKSLYVDEVTGVIDIDMHPVDPDTLMVATYERERDGFDTNDPSKKYGPGSAIWRTTDGGANWTRIRAGLPTCNLGRVGIDWYRKDPSVLMAVVESEKIAQQPEGAPYLGAQLGTADVGAKVASVEIRRGGGGRGGEGGPRGGGRGGEEPARGGARRGDPPAGGGEQRGDPPARGGEEAAAQQGQQEPQEAREQQEPQAPQETPAKLAGLREGDVILAIAGNRVNSPDDVDRECRRHKADDKVTFTIVRDREDIEIAVTFGKQPEGTRSPFTGTLGGQAENLQDRQGPDGHEYGGIYKSTDGGESWARINSLNPRPMYYSQVRIDPSDSNNVMVLGTSLYRSTDGGKTFNGNAGRGMHVDHHAEWIDPRDGNHIIHGCDGGIHVTYDAGRNWDHLNHVAIGQFYHVGVSPERNYKVYGGLQDNGSWGAPSRTAGTGARNEDWIRVGGGDGFRCLVDPDHPDVVYSQGQNGPPSWRDLVTGQRGSLRPGGGGDRERPRFNWETPYILSEHNSKIVYTAGNRVFKSLNRGANMQAISPEITNTDRGSATALAESPRNADIVYVGTDDGALWVTRDGGDKWIDCFEVAELAAAAPATNGDGDGDGAAAEPAPASARGTGARATNGRRAAPAAAKKDGKSLASLVPGPRWVSEIAASRFDEKRAYVTLDAHRSNDDAPYLLATDDAGATWRSLTASLPEGAGCTRTIAEDPVNPNVLYLGTEFQTFVSLDRGEHWTRFNGNLPTVAVHAFAANIPSGEIVAATHGRSLWITNVNEIRQMTKEALAKDVHFYKPISAVVWKSEMSTGGTNRRFTAENPRDGARLVYHLGKKVGEATMEVFDSTGEAIRKLECKTEPGLHTVDWDLRGTAGAAPEGADPRFARFRGNRGRRVSPGTFTIRLTVDGAVQSHPLVVEIDPGHPDPIWLTFEQQAEELEAAAAAEEAGRRDG